MLLRCLLMSALWAGAPGQFSAAFAAPGDQATPNAPYEEALISDRKGELEVAAIHLKNALQQAPEHLPARILLGEILLKMGYPVAAEFELKKARLAGADEALVIVSLAKAYLMQDKYLQVIDEIIPAARDRETEMRVLLMRGEAFLGMDRVDDAETAFFGASMVKPENPDPVVALGRIAFIRGNIHITAEFVERALALSRTSTTAWTLKGDLERYNQNTDAALDAYSTTVAIDGGHIPARLGLASIHIEREEHAQARAEIAEIREIFEDDPSANYLEALILTAEGDRAAARIRFENAATRLEEFAPLLIESDPSAVYLYGLINFALGSYEEALTYLTRYIVHRPADPEGHKLLGLLHIQLGNNILAIESLQIAVAIRGNDVDTLNLLATAYIRDSQFNKGTSYFLDAANLAPMSAGAHTNLGIGRLRGGQAALAIEELKKSLAIEPDSMDTAIFLALAQLRDSAFDGALETALELDRSHPDEPYVQNLIGTAYVGNDNDREARDYFQRALALDGNNIAAQFNLARISMGQGDTEAAKKRYREALTWPQGKTAATVELAKILWAENRTDEAINTMEKARAEDPDLRDPWFHLVGYYLSTENFDEATRLAQNYREKAPGDAVMLELLTRIQMATGDRKSAIGSQLEIVKISEDRSPALLRLGQVQEFAGDPNGAKVSYGRAIAWDRDYAEAWLALINVEARTSNMDEAQSLVEEMQRAVPRDKGDPSILAAALLATGRLDDAEELLRSAMARGKTKELVGVMYRTLVQKDRHQEGIDLLRDWVAEHPEDTRARFTLAAALTKIGRLEPAIGHFEKLRTESPDNPVILNNLAWLYYETERPGALELARRAYEFTPGDTSVLDTLGWILVQDGEAVEGLSLLREAQARASAAESIMYHLAAALYALGRTEEARIEIEGALRSGRDFSGLDDALALRRQLATD